MFKLTRKAQSRFFAGIVILASSHVATASELLNLREAEVLALKNDPTLATVAARAAALDEAAVADAQLPDPKLKLSAFNFPTDTFNRKQEQITQLRFGVTQQIPRGDSLEIQSAQTSSKARFQRARRENERLKIIQSTRNSWLETYYWLRAEDIVRENIELFTQLVDITQAEYAAGKQTQQDVLRAQLERSVLDDRITDIINKQEQARASLAKWIGVDSIRPLAKLFPSLGRAPTPEEIENAMQQHPVLKMEAARVYENKLGVDLAREAYKPSFNLGVDYGIRDGNNPDGSRRSDFLAGTIVLDLPLFTDKRQNRRLAAAQKRKSAALLSREDTIRTIRSELQKEYADWLRLGDRLKLYDESLLQQARLNTEATFNAYQSDEADFNSLVRARITELDTKLKALRIRVNRAKTQSNLLYLAGEPK